MIGESRLSWTVQYGINDAVAYGMESLPGFHYGAAWASIREARAVFWPAIELRADEVHRIAPLGRPTESHAEVMAALWRELSQRSPAQLEPGWMDAPDEGWAPVAAMPSQGAGDYRSPGEPVLAERDAGSGLDATLTRVLAWRVGHRYGHRVTAPRRVAITQRFVYAESGGTIGRVPRAALRAPLRTDGDLLYPFYRREALLLEDRPGCPVQALLPAG